MPWVEHKEFADRLIDRLLLLTETVASFCDLRRLAHALVEGLEISDATVVNRLMDKFSVASPDERNQLYGLIDAAVSRNTSRVGNLVLLKLLQRDASHFNTISDALRSNGCIPMHAKISELSGSQVLDLLDLVGTNSSDVLSDLELIADASCAASETLTVRVELFAKFSDLQFPCRTLADSIARDFSDLAPTEAVEFLHSCAVTRIRPDWDISSWVPTHLHSLDPREVASLIESISSLGLLDSPRVAGILTSRFIQASSALDKAEQARESARVLCSLFVSLLVPTDRQIDALVGMIKSSSSTIDDQDRAIMYLMSQELNSPSLSDLVADSRIDESVVDDLRHCEPVVDGPEHFVSNGSLSQGFKFKKFLASRRV
jgi:hypothetical protein